MCSKRLPFILALSLLLVTAYLSSEAGIAGAVPPTPQGQLEALQGFWQATYVAPRLPGSEQSTARLDAELLAKAEPDECFNGIGVPYTGTVPICDYGMPKVNQAYVWGLAKPGDDLWFGTAPNTLCLVYSSFMGITTPLRTESYVCEFSESQYSPPLPAAIGDWRPPDLFRYDTQTMTLVEVTPADPLFGTSLGIRSAGTLDGVVLFGGPSLRGGINIFAFDALTDAYLGSTNLPQYNNIRKWLEVDGVLYTGVRDTATGAGHVLRWSGDLANPFQFEVVGNLGSEAAELAVHDGRLFVSTWPNRRATPPEAGSLYMSPPLPDGGLTSQHADAWLKVWQAGNYEPDPVTAITYGGGALHSFGGYLYWGTMHIPFVAAIAHFNIYGQPATPAGTIAGLIGSHRAISIFRGHDFGTASQEIELLYGEQLLPTYQNGLWLLMPNGMNARPLWGPSGLGNFYNNYTWTMDLFKGQLFVGTMDWSYLLDDGLPLLLQFFGLPPDTQLPFPIGDHGADLYRFRSASSPAQAESIDGVGNPANYGIRTMLSDDALYLGTANPMNLLTNPSDDKPEGGWELLRLSVPSGLHLYLPIVAR